MKRRTFFHLTAGTAFVGAFPTFAVGCGDSRVGEAIEADIHPIVEGRISFDGAGRRYRIDALGGTVTTIDASGTASEVVRGAELNVPIAIASDADGPRYLITCGGCEVHRLAADGTIDATFGGPGTEPGRLLHPQDVAVDARGLVHVADTLNHRIQIFDPDGGYVGAFGVAGLGEGELNAPRGLCFGPDGDLYVANTGNGRIERFRPDGRHRASFRAPSGRFTPTGIRLRPQGDLVVSDVNAGALHLFALDGVHLRVETTIVGGWLVQPVAMAIEPSTGRVVVSVEGAA